MLSHKLRREVGAVSTPTDADFKQTVLLLHGDGTNGGQNNTFIDGSTNNFTITRSGNTTQGTFSPFIVGASEWSNYFDGTNDRLTIADNANLRPGTSTFTIEAWVYRVASGAAHTIFAKGASTPTGFSFGITSSNTLRFTDTSTNIDSTGTISASTWTHVAVVREGTGSNQLKLYINGTNDGTGTSSTNFNQTEEARIGENRGATDDFNGYISNFRFVIGSTVYTANFTVPTAPLTAITNTQLLTCQSNRFVDKSSNNFTITRNGDALIRPFSPFAPTAAYSTSTNGGSGYFDGTGDYLTIASNAAFGYGTGDFTWECWFYASANSGYILDHGANGGTIAYNGTTLVYYNATIGIGSVLYTTGFASNPPLNTWHHVAAVRSGGTTSLYFNGTRSASAADSHNYGNQAVYIGQWGGGGLNFNGYISNLRLVKGTAVYSGTTLTVPTAPLTAITNTSLLCNFTNAAIIDNTGKNVLETVGNAQIDTGTKKFGTGSLEFDGTGDWLLAPNNVDNQLGTGNFTIELWVYLASGDTGSNRGLVSKGTSTTGWSVSLNTTEKVVFSYTSSTITSSGAITTNAWNHIAVVREGTGSNQTKIYINGTNDGTGTVSTDFNQTNSLYVGANRTGGDPMKGFIDDLRITKGKARYTANFTAPTAAFADL
jgi:hypothetical protein